MIICHDKKFIFFKPLKTAGSSVEFSLSDVCLDKDIMTGGTKSESDIGFIQRNNIDKASGRKIFHSHTWPELLYRKTNSLWPEYLKISMIRNPWDLCVSYYWWTMHEYPSRSLMITEADSEHLLKRKFRLFLETPGEFTDSIEGNSSVFMSDAVTYLSKTNLSFIDSSVDIYLKYESLQKDYNTFRKLIRSDPTALPRLKSKQRKNPSRYQLYYSEYTKHLVKDRFRLLVDRFGYSF